jgi:hypothetical protein
MRFGNDWTGVFLRGDDALPYAMYISEFIKDIEKKTEQDTDVFGLMMLRGLARLLGGCDERGQVAGRQDMKPLEECLIVKPRPTSEGGSSPTG